MIRDVMFWVVISWAFIWLLANGVYQVSSCGMC